MLRIRCIKMRPSTPKLLAKAFITGLLLWVALRSVNVAALSRLLAGVDPGWAALALVLTLLIIMSDALLLSAVLRMFERSMSFRTAFLYSLVGWFFSNVAPSTVGGDVFRGVQLARVGIPAGAAIRVILSQRLLSFATLVLVMASGFPIALKALGEGRDVFLLASVLSVSLGALVVLFLVAHVAAGPELEHRPFFRRLRTLSGDFGRLLVPSSRNAGAWAAALAQHLLRVAVLACLGRALGLDIGFAILFAFAPAALLVAMLPVSLGGWGVREISFVYLLGAVGYNREAALALSITFGLLRLAVGAIGGAAWSLLGDTHYRIEAPSA